MTYLGIDLGTSGLRALLVDEEGQPIGSAEAPCEVSHPHSGWSEQDPAQWIEALEIAVARLISEYPRFADLRGIAVAGHMHGATLLDAKGAVLRPCILWNDTRSYEEAARLDAMPAFRELSGNIVFPGFTAPKLDWLRHHEPDCFKNVAKVLLPAAYLSTYLTGAHVADMSDSAGTSWLDLKARAWSNQLLTASHMCKSQMPRLVEGSAAAGRLRPEIASRWGLRGTVTVAGGAGDNAAAACGIGALGDDTGFVSLGTSGVVLIARDACQPMPETAIHSFCHAVPDRWYQMGVVLAATDSLNWLSRITGQSAAGLTSALGDIVRAPGSAQFYPYLSGERTPHNDANVRGSFAGLSQETGPKEMAQAVQEGVAFALKDCAIALRQAGGGPKRLYVIGGGAASRYWVSLLATVLGLPLYKPRSGEFGAALGAARLAMTAATGADPASVMTPPEDCEQVDPDVALIPLFEERYEHFRSAFPALHLIQ